MVGPPQEKPKKLKRKIKKELGDILKIKPESEQIPIESTPNDGSDSEEEIISTTNTETTENQNEDLHKQTNYIDKLVGLRKSVKNYSGCADIVK